VGAVLRVMLTAQGATIAGAASQVEVVARDDVFDSASAQVDAGGRVTWRG
jgi:plastocyanin